ncbi:MAG: discoidin domain-containing protein, partial [Planctomycetaceae bacterium]|nr:discoidin domain-containing protein [Planctomycetaceae bacterium]
MKIKFSFLMMWNILFCCFLVSVEIQAVEPVKKNVEVIIQSDSEDIGFESFRAMDGDKKTMWHSEWKNAAPALPHTLTVDLQDILELKGFIVTARNDNFNGDIKGYDVFVTNNLDVLGEPIASGEFVKGETPNQKTPNRVEFSEPQKGRYLILKILSNHSGGQYASVAELELLCDSTTFKAKKITKSEIELEALRKELSNVDCVANAEQLNEFLRLSQNIKEKAKFDKIAGETFLSDSLILDGDRDPVDVVLHRVTALLADLKTLDAVPDLSDYEKSLTALKNEVEKIPVEQTKQRLEYFVKITELRRQIAFANPLLNFKELLFVKKHRATFNHMCDQYYGVNLPSGGGVFVLSNPFGKDGKKPEVRNLLENSAVQSGRLAGKKLVSGSFLSPDISFDARKLAFAYVECEGDTKQRFHTDPSTGHWHEGRCFHIFTCNIDGSELQQITDGT